MLDDQSLTDLVLQLEQRITIGGGWQDQAGGIHSGVKLIVFGPGQSQRLRVQPIVRSAEREAEFASLLILVLHRGLRRIAKCQVQQVVGRYLARETSTVQILHSIKTLVVEMAYAMQDDHWDRRGALMDRHWGIEPEIRPDTTNATIEALRDLTSGEQSSLGQEVAGL